MIDLVELFFKIEIFEFKLFIDRLCSYIRDWYWASFPYNFILREPKALLVDFFLLGLNLIIPLIILIWLFLYCWAVIDSFLED